MAGTVNGVPLGTCPCGKQIFADESGLAVAHELPPCDEFVRMEALEFLRYVRRSRGIPDEALES